MEAGAIAKRSPRKLRSMLLDSEERQSSPTGAKNLHAGVLWKVKPANDRIRHLAQEISKQSVERVAWLLQTAYRNCKKRDELNMELLGKEEPENKDLKNSQPVYIERETERERERKNTF
jgi:hypothetical protein